MASRALPEEEVAVVANCLCWCTSAAVVVGCLKPDAAARALAATRTSCSCSTPSPLAPRCARPATRRRGRRCSAQLLVARRSKAQTPAGSCLARRAWRWCTAWRRRKRRTTPTSKPYSRCVDAQLFLHHTFALRLSAHALLFNHCRSLTRRVFSQPCRLVCFHRGSNEPPLYMPSPTGVEASKLRLWELVEGVGPPKLAAEAAGGALRRADLAPFGVRSPALPQSALPPRDDARERLRALDAAASRAQPHRAASLHAAWLCKRPLFERSWADVKAEFSRCCEPIKDAAKCD